MKVAIIGASGLVGRKMIQVLAQRKFPVGELYLAASDKSAGSKINLSGYDFPLIKVSDVVSLKPDVVLLSAGAEVSITWAPVLAENGSFVIDNSSAWRMEDHVPLVVPEVNADQLTKDRKIIANPNCSTIQLVAVLAPLHKSFGLKRVIVSTYQSVSGSGKRGIDQLMNERHGVQGEACYPYPIDHNALAHGGYFLDNGYSSEEMKLIQESRKILGIDNLNITATVVRIPLISCHSESVNVEFDRDFGIEEVREILKSTPGIELQDTPAENIYPMPLIAYERDEIFVGRLRKDLYQERTLNMWIVADNLRKGAATNAVQIAELLLEKKLVGN